MTSIVDAATTNVYSNVVPQLATHNRGIKTQFFSNHNFFIFLTVAWRPWEKNTLNIAKANDEVLVFTGVNMGTKR